MDLIPDNNKDIKYKFPENQNYEYISDFNIKMLRKALGFQDNPGQRMTANALGKSAAGQGRNNLVDASSNVVDASTRTSNTIFPTTFIADPDTQRAAVNYSGVS